MSWDGYECSHCGEDTWLNAGHKCEGRIKHEAALAEIAFIRETLTYAAMSLAKKNITRDDAIYLAKKIREIK